MHRLLSDSEYEVGLFESIYFIFNTDQVRVINIEKFSNSYKFILDIFTPTKSPSNAKSVAKVFAKLELYLSTWRRTSAINHVTNHL